MYNVGQKGVSSLKYVKPDKSNVFRNIFRNISDSNNGLKIMFKESSTVQRLIPIEIILGGALGAIFGFISLEYILMLAALVHLFTAETSNTSVEVVNDRITTEYDEQVKRSKDIASASVWIWHLVYIVCVIGFIVMHLLNFAWWKVVIPGS